MVVANLAQESRRAFAFTLIVLFQALQYQCQHYIESGTLLLMHHTIIDYTSTSTLTWGLNNMQGQLNPRVGLSKSSIDPKGKLEGTSFTANTTLTLETAMSLYKLTESQSFWEIEQDTRCLVGWGSNTVMVAFRGTASMKNALADLQVPLLLHFLLPFILLFFLPLSLPFLWPFLVPLILPFWLPFILLVGQIVHTLLILFAILHICLDCRCCRHVLPRKPCQCNHTLAGLIKFPC